MNRPTERESRIVRSARSTTTEAVRVGDQQARRDPQSPEQEAGKAARGPFLESSAHPQPEENIMKAIRPTLTPAELAIVDASAAEMERYNKRAAKLAEACRAHGWYTIASLADWQPNETYGSDYGPWLYEHHVYATAYDDSTYIGTIAYKDGECPNLYGIDDGALLYPVLLGDKNQHHWEI